MNTHPSLPWFLVKIPGVPVEVPVQAATKRKAHPQRS